MPIKSKAQYKFMQAAANNPEFANKADIEQDVAREFVKETPKGKFKKLKEKLRSK